MKGRGRDFVIDADVARAAGDIEAIMRDKQPVTTSIAHARRAALEALYEARHRAVFSPRLHAEWFRRDGRSPSRGARVWYARMLERRLIVRLDTEPDATPISEAIDTHLTPDCRALAHKDAHLVATSCANGQRILSGDDRARAQFARLATLLGSALAGLHWCNPAAPDAVSWLRERAPDHPAHRLAPPTP